MGCGPDLGRRRMDDATKGWLRRQGAGGGRVREGQESLAHEVGPRRIAGRGLREDAENIGRALRVKREQVERTRMRERAGRALVIGEDIELATELHVATDDEVDEAVCGPDRNDRHDGELRKRSQTPGRTVDLYGSQEGLVRSLRRRRGRGDRPIAQTRTRAWSAKVRR